MTVKPSLQPPAQGTAHLQMGDDCHPQGWFLLGIWLKPHPQHHATTLGTEHVEAGHDPKPWDRADLWWVGTLCCQCSSVTGVPM